MLIQESEINARVESPLNLLNRLKSITTQASPGKSKTAILSIPPTPSILNPPKSEDLISDIDNRLEFSGAKQKALRIMNNALTVLDSKLEETPTGRLASIAESMSKIINSDVARKDTSNVNVVVYSPQIVQEQDFDVIEVIDSK